MASRIAEQLLLVRARAHAVRVLVFRGPLRAGSAGLRLVVTCRTRLLRRNNNGVLNPPGAQRERLHTISGAGGNVQVPRSFTSASFEGRMDMRSIFAAFPFDKSLSSTDVMVGIIALRPPLSNHSALATKFHLSANVSDGTSMARWNGPFSRVNRLTALTTCATKGFVTIIW